MMIMMMMMTLVMAPDDVVMRVGSDVDRGKKLIQKKTTKKKLGKLWILGRRNQRFQA